MDDLLDSSFSFSPSKSYNSRYSPLVPSDNLLYISPSTASVEEEPELAWPTSDSPVNNSIPADQYLPTPPKVKSLERSGSPAPLLVDITPPSSPADFVERPPPPRKLLLPQSLLERRMSEASGSGRAESGKRARNSTGAAVGVVEVPTVVISTAPAVSGPEVVNEEAEAAEVDDGPGESFSADISSASSSVICAGAAAAADFSQIMDEHGSFLVNSSLSTENFDSINLPQVVEEDESEFEAAGEGQILPADLLKTPSTVREKGKNYLGDSTNTIMGDCDEEEEGKRELLFASTASFRDLRVSPLKTLAKEELFSWFEEDERTPRRRLGRDESFDSGAGNEESVDAGTLWKDLSVSSTAIQDTLPPASTRLSDTFPTLDLLSSLSSTASTSSTVTTQHAQSLSPPSTLTRPRQPTLMDLTPTPNRKRYASSTFAASNSADVFGSSPFASTSQTLPPSSTRERRSILGFGSSSASLGTVGTSISSSSRGLAGTPSTERKLSTRERLDAAKEERKKRESLMMSPRVPSNISNLKLVASETKPVGGIPKSASRGKLSLEEVLADNAAKRGKGLLGGKKFVPTISAPKTLTTRRPSIATSTSSASTSRLALTTSTSRSSTSITSSSRTSTVTSTSRSSALPSSSSHPRLPTSSSSSSISRLPPSTSLSRLPASSSNSSISRLSQNSLSTSSSSRPLSTSRPASTRPPSASPRKLVANSAIPPPSSGIAKPGTRLPLRSMQAESGIGRGLGPNGLKSSIPKNGGR